MWIHRECDDHMIEVFDGKMMGIIDEAVLKHLDRKVVVEICSSSLMGIGKRRHWCHLGDISFVIAVGLAFP